jgi:hypothetical protein
MLVREASVSNMHHQINKVTSEAYKQSLHLVLKAPITVSHRSLNALTPVKWIIPKMNIYIPMSKMSINVSKISFSV